MPFPKIIANTTKKDINGCIYSEKLTDVVDQPFSKKDSDQKIQQNLPIFCCIEEDFPFNYVNVY